MPKITIQNWKVIDKFLLYVGCEYVRKKGSHRIFRRSDLNRPIVLPEYKAVPVFIIQTILRQLGISHDEYLEILKRI